MQIILNSCVVHMEECCGIGRFRCGRTWHGTLQKMAIVHLSRRAPTCNSQQGDIEAAFVDLRRPCELWKRIAKCRFQAREIHRVFSRNGRGAPPPPSVSPRNARPFRAEPAGSTAVEAMAGFGATSPLMPVSGEERLPTPGG